MPALRAKNLDVKLHHRRIIKSLSLDLTEVGRSYGLVGINGAGKTTLFRSLAGAIRPLHGTVMIGGQDLYARKGRNRKALKEIALMPQRVEFPSAFTAHELVSHITWLRGANRRDAADASRRTLERVSLGDVADLRLGRLSGGMLRRVALAQALAGRPHVLLLDEPSVGLDPEQRRIMVDILHGIDDSIILMSSHMMIDIEEVTQETIVIHRGTIIHRGPTQDVRKYDSRKKRTLEGGFLSLIGRSAG